MPPLKLPDELAMRDWVLRICVGSILTVFFCALVPAIIFVLGGFGLLAAPVTILVLACLPVIVAMATQRLPDRALWVVCACVPAFAFTGLFVGRGQAFLLVAKATGYTSSVTKANLGPPLLAGYVLGAITVYVAVLTGIVWLRIQFANPR